MQAVKGYFADGRFTPENGIELPNHVSAILVVEKLAANAIEKNTEDIEMRTNWLNDLRQAREVAINEAMPDFRS